MQVAVQVGKEHGLGIPSRKFCICQASPRWVHPVSRGDRKRGEEKREREETRMYIDVRTTALGQLRWIPSRFEVF